MSIWVAIEGPCLAGKTTLGDALLDALGAGHDSIIPDYADFVGGGPRMPDPDPRSWEEERAVLDVLLDIETARLRAHLPSPAPGLMLLDRSVWTIVGHCAGTDHRDRRDPGFAERAVGVLSGDPRPCWPQAVLYLDVSHEVQLARNRGGKFAADSVFVDRDYNAGFRSYFAELHAAEELPTAWIDGEVAVAAVLEHALRFLADEMGLQRPAGHPPGR